VIDGVDVGAAIEQERGLACFSHPRHLVQHRRVMAVHVVGIHTALEKHRGEILVLEVVERAPLR
jgi:hypothetical protein